MSYYYLLALALAFGGLLIADRKYRLVFFRNRQFAGYALLACVVFFFICDVIGIILGVFSTNSEWVSGIYVLTQDLPLEELCFLFFLGYVTLITWEVVCSRTS